jgi:hypothetical protein
VCGEWQRGGAEGVQGGSVTKQKLVSCFLRRPGVWQVGVVSGRWSVDMASGSGVWRAGVVWESSWQSVVVTGHERDVMSGRGSANGRGEQA